TANRGTLCTVRQKFNRIAVHGYSDRLLQVSRTLTLAAFTLVTLVRRGEAVVQIIRSTRIDYESLTRLMALLVAMIFDGVVRSCRVPLRGMSTTSRKEPRPEEQDPSGGRTH